MSAPRLILVLSENWTLTDPRDLRALVRVAVEAEDAGFDGVMASEHIVLGPGSDANGLMANPREYALPGNQDPATPWPNSLLLLSAIAARTTRLRLIAAGVIAPLRHPIALAQQLATLDLLSEGRLVAQPIVSWHRPEYEALDVSFRLRGRLLDEHLAAWEVLWRDTPASYAGEHYRFQDAYLVPKAYRESGPRLWLGGSSLHDALLRRLVRYGHGFHPLGQPTDAELTALRAALTEAGRDPADLEMVGGIRPTFPDAHSPAPIALALESIPEQLARGFTTICVKPSQYTDDLAEVGPLCKEIVRRVAAL
ncbi:TIGR03619 family F420-dependent LLM class oxidoreductase [Embleya sp. NBC_00896]|uniref:TIGR03619 family F420-dependent LLM class oxidoreductase n=1 Tax=Embleya sp. NBC_00896 TaxID=2975961 RepID=UPI002F913C73|nr:TIGR03619 family F420-dependent LLM class oxidoreductase [Embleya sp. NBC_00896]